MEHMEIYMIRWNEEQQEWMGTVGTYPTLSAFGNSPAQALEEIMLVESLVKLDQAPTTE